MDVVLETRAQQLAEKCAKYAAEHGKENADYLVDYGKALFAIAKQSSSLVDSQKMDERQLPQENPHVKVADFNAFEPEESEEPTNEPANESGPDSVKDEAGAAKKEAAANNEAKSSKNESVNSETEPGTSKEDSASEEADKSAEPEDSREDANEASEAEDETDYAAAFEIVDVARVLYEKEGDAPETLAKLAKTRELLGDIALEDDNAPQAVEDYSAAVDLKKKVHGAESGEVSEAEFMLSLAHDAAGNQQLALEHLKLAAKAAEAAGLPSAGELQQRAKDLQQDLEASAKLQGADTVQAKKTTEESISGRTAIASAVQSLVAGANDISQLARKRKRPAESQPNKKTDKSS